MHLTQQKILFVLFILFLLVSSGCSHWRSAGSEAGTAKPPFSPSANPELDLRNGLARLKNVYPYRVTSELIESGETTPTSSKFVTEYAARDRIHFKSDDFEGIDIGEKHYSHRGGKWHEIGPVAEAPEIETIIEEHMTDVRLAGSESLNGVACAIYITRYDFEEKGQVAAGTSRMWISMSDGLPRQLDSEIKRGDLVHNIRMHYEFDPGIRVKNPLP